MLRTANKTTGLVSNYIEPLSRLSWSICRRLSRLGVRPQSLLETEVHVKTILQSIYFNLWVYIGQHD